jgi:hypothetical protein
MRLSAGRFLVYDAQNFAANPDGSKRQQVIWDSENWGPEHVISAGDSTAVATWYKVLL